jgi:formamidopyrimidine-DNA glycosylase
MPELDAFSSLVKKRSCPIKALLLDQTFSAGVGNWVAGQYYSYFYLHWRLIIETLDEVLYHARIHPEQRCNTLSDDQMGELHHHTRNVCVVAVGVNADDEKFPENWLFKHRWV